MKTEETINLDHLEGLLIGLAFAISKGASKKSVALMFKNHSISQRGIDYVRISDINLDLLLPVLKICKIMTPRTRNIIRK